MVAPARSSLHTRRNNGITFDELYTRLEHERPTRVDAVVDTSEHIEMVPLTKNDVGILFNTAGTELSAIDGHVAAITPFAHSHIGGHAGIPRPYYERMRLEQPSLLIRNIETWWKEDPKVRMARMVEPVTVENGDVKKGMLTTRAWLSDRYRCLDNYSFVMTVLETANKFNANIHTCHLDDERVYIKLVSPDLAAEIKKGDVLEAGVIVRNSEVGDGKVAVQPYFNRLVCRNGMIGTTTYGQVHLGGEKEYGILEQDTLEANAKSVWLEVRDWVAAVFKGHFLRETVDQFRRAEGVRVPVEARLAVANVVRNFGLTGYDGQGILERYLRNNDDSQFGLVNAVTQFAHEGENDFRKQVELEQHGGKLLDMSERQVEHLLTTALKDEQVAKAVNAN